MEAGLPNFSGRIGKYNTGLIGGVWGCVFVNGMSAGSRYLAHSGDSPLQVQIDIAGSASNTLYGASNTVTPLSETCLICIHY